MDDGQYHMRPEPGHAARHSQQMGLVYTVMVCLALLILLQALLLDIAVEGLLGGAGKVMLPAAIASGACFAAACWLGVSLRKIQ